MEGQGVEGINVVSADSHIFEPIDLWESRIDKAFRDRAPKAVANYEGKEGTFWVAEGLAPRAIASIAALNIKPQDLKAFYKSSYDDLRKGGWDPSERIKDQDIDGVRAEVIYATYGMNLYGVQDISLREACFRTYNDWLVEYCSHDSKRLSGLALISLDHVHNAVAELKRCKEMGMVGGMISAVPKEGKELSLPEFDPFWAAAADLEMPISLHILTSSRAGQARFDRTTFGAGYYIIVPHEIQLTLTDVILRGVLERHPALKIVLAEADTGWIPHFLERIEKGFTRWEHLNNLRLSLRPTEYFHRQVYATFIKDRFGVLSREYIGVDNMMWSSDYPHTDSTWPRSQESIAHDLEGVSEADTRKLLHQNAVKLYGLSGA